MAKVDDLIRLVQDPSLRKELYSAVGEIRKGVRFGLVYEEHLPEMAPVPGLPLHTGMLAVVPGRERLRDAWRVVEIDKENIKAESVDGAENATFQHGDLIPLQRIGSPIYPGLNQVGSVENGGPDKPAHVVICSENFHAVQMLLHLYEGKIDCIYLDPPYNTGARDWTYNNDYVDDTDTFRHSKWLSFMDRRLRIAKNLLADDGIICVTIDDYELPRLVMLLDDIFGEKHRLGSVVIRNNPQGRSTIKGFSINHEYALFYGKTTKSTVGRLPRSDEQLERYSELDENSQSFLWENFRKTGSDSHRSDRPKQFYPLYIQGENIRLPEMKWDIESRSWLIIDKQNSNEEEVWPIDSSKNERVWKWGHERVLANPNHLQVRRLGGRIEVHRRNYPSEGSLPNTLWDKPKYASGSHGTNLLTRMFGRSHIFDFPKSVYAVQDCIRVCSSKKNAAVLDFFAGSGTTFHAACLLNAEDGGSRKTIMVTNNDVSEQKSKELRNEGFRKGDPSYEINGIFENVTKPRCEAVVTGKRPDGSPVPGTYIGGRAMSKGFHENIVFYQLAYLDPDLVDLGTQFGAVEPMLWLMAGGYRIGQSANQPNTQYAFPEGARYGVLFKESAFSYFLTELRDKEDVTYVFLVTDSEESYAEMTSSLPKGVGSRMLYREYLRSFKIEAAGGAV